MVNIREKITELEEELRTTQYNKSTERHIGLVKAKIARLKERIDKKRAKAKAKPSQGIKKSGDATVAIVGLQLAGKSTLLNALTGARNFKPGIGIGVMKHQGAMIQVLDIPSNISKEAYSIIRGSDLIIILVDISDLKQIGIIKKELYNNGLRLDQEAPGVKIEKTIRGGINLAIPKKMFVSKETIKSVLREFRINNANVTIRENITIDRLIDCLEANKAYIPSLIVINKIDTANKSEINNIKSIKGAVTISAMNKKGLEELKQKTFKKLKLIRIYLKQVGKKPDLSKPLIMKKGDSVKHVCKNLHKDFLTQFRYAKIWGPSAKYAGQTVGLKHKLLDKDIVQVHLK